MRSLFPLFIKYKSKIFAEFSDFFSPLKPLANGRYQLKETFPYYPQWASRNLILKITNHQISARDDPEWKTFGFRSKKEYEFWSWRACGIACLKMIIEGFCGKKGLLFAPILKKALRLGGYKIYNQEGKFVDKGWFYQPLLKVLYGYKIKGAIFKSLSVNQIAKEILDNHAVVVSVDALTFGTGKVNRNLITGNHLVLVFGYQIKNGKISGFYLHNSSGRTRKLQENAFIPIKLFKTGFAYRGFSVWPA